MAINPLFPFLAGALKARSDIKAVNEDEYDDITGQFIDAASAEYLRSQTAEKKRIEKNKKAYNFIANDSRFGTATAEYFSKQGLYDVFDTPAEVLNYAETKLKTDPNLFTQLKNFNKDNPQVFKNVFADNQEIAKKKLDNKAEFASQNLNKGATKFLSDTFLEPGQSKFSKFMFGPKVADQGALTATTALTEGFEAAEKKAETPVSESQRAEGAVTIDDTVVQKFEYTPIQSIGNARDVSNAVASVLGYSPNQSNIGADGMILFPGAFKTDSEAIKEQMQISANTGAYRNVDGSVNTTALAQDSNRIIENNIKQPIQNVFNVDYSRAMTADGKSFDPNSKTITAGAMALENPITVDGVQYGFSFDKKIFTELFGKHVSTLLTDNDLLIRSNRPAVTLPQRFDKPQRGGTAAREKAQQVQKAGSKDAGYLITANAFNAIEKYINNETVNTFERKLFIESLPDNYSYTVTLQNGKVTTRNMKSDLLRLFGYPQA
jgi:hypothetical protein